MARTVPRTFKDFILVATAVLVVKLRHALMASQRIDTPATTRDRPYGVHRVPLQATCRPYCTANLGSVRAETAPAERGARGASAFNSPCALGRYAHLYDHQCRVGAQDVLAERLPRCVGLTIQLSL